MDDESTGHRPVPSEDQPQRPPVAKPSLDFGHAGLEFGEYDLIEKIGEGGMGVVYRASQRRLKREVAIKLLPSVMIGGRKAIERFRIEAESMAAIDHPNIVPVYEVGEVEGQPYLCMKLVTSAPLSRQVGNHPTDTKTAVGIMRKVASAIDAAHRLGFLHRDLKPGNILMAQGKEPLVTDFGLAKRLDDSTEPITLSGQTLGTPAYMAPEQAGRAILTIATDIYGLGAVLYQLLTGQAPFQGNSAPDILRRVMDEDPQNPLSLNPSVDRDLNAITMRCLEKNPERRYASAGALTDDLDRWLAGETVQARPVTGIHRAVRWARRKPFQAGFAVTLSLFLLTLAIGGPIVAWSQKRLREKADTSKTLADKNAETLRRHLYYSQMQEASAAAAKPSGMPQVRRLLAEWEPQAGLADLRGWEWYHLKSLTLSHGETMQAVESPVRGFSLTAKRTNQALAMDKSITIHDSVSQAELHRLPPISGLIHELGCSFDGRFLGVNLSQVPRLLVFDLETKAKAVSLPASPNGSRQAWSPSALVVAVQHYKRIFIYDLRKRRQLAEYRAQFHSDMYFDWLPSGAGLVIYERGILSVLSPNPDQPVQIWFQQKTPPAVSAMRIDPAGELVAFGDIQGNLRIFDISRRAYDPPIKAHESRVRDLAWSPDGRHLVSGGDDLSLQIRPAENLSARPEWLRGHSGAVTGVLWPEASRIVSWSDDGTVRSWQPFQQPVLRSGQPHHLSAVSWHPDGRIVTGVHSDFVSYDLTKPTAPADLQLLVSDASSDLQWMPNETNLAFFSGHRLVIWKPQSFSLNNLPKDLRVLHRHDRAFAIALSGLAPWIASAGGDGVKVSDYSTGQAVRATEAFEVTALQFHPTVRRHLAFADLRQRRIRLLDVNSGNLNEFVRPHGNRCDALDFHPDGTRLASGADEGRIEFWEYPSGRPVTALAGHTGAITALDFSPAGTRLASASLDTTIRIWDVATGSQVAVLRGHTAGVLDVEWSPDGRTLASCGQAGEMRVWRSTAP